jgi:hypothetical protein
LWDGHFFTVTFKPSRSGRSYGLQFCQRHLLRFLRMVVGIAPDDELLVVRSPHYGLVVWEKTRAGEWHAHGLLAGGRINYQRAIEVRRADRVIGSWKVRPVDRVHGPGSYLAKYLTKQGYLEAWQLIGDWPREGIGSRVDEAVTATA